MKKDELEFTVELVNKNHLDKIKIFTCGNDEIDEYLRKKAFEDLESGDGTTKVVIDTIHNKIIAYYTLCCSAIVANQYNKKYYSPAVEIKMFALNQEYQKLKIEFSEDEDYEENLSDLILANVIKEVYEFTEDSCAARNIILYSVEKAKSFYKRNSFESFEDYMETSDSKYLNGCTPMFYGL